MKKTVAIIGHGYVGKAIEDFFKGKYEIAIYDPMQGHTNKAAAESADLAVICVWTPMREDRSVDISAVEEILEWLRTPSIVIKSTVPPGTTKSLAEKHSITDRLVFSPEYMGEGGYPLPFWEGIPDPADMKRHHFHILGGTSEATAKALPFFQQVAGPFPHFLQTDSTTAELTKYMENAWIATKVTFCNEFYDIAQSFGVDYNKLRELWLMDGRVGRSHTLVYPDKRGFTGKCIPKDTNGIYHAAKQAGHESALLLALLEHNKRWTGV
jgi:UDPglucose 6-dehydrogenase